MKESSKSHAIGGKEKGHALNGSDTRGMAPLSKMKGPGEKAAKPFKDPVQGSKKAKPMKMGC